MITALWCATVLEDKVEAFKGFIARATGPSRALDGCVSYDFYQQQDDPRKFVLYGQWRDQEALEAFFANLASIFGPPSPEHPNSTLPAAVLEVCESEDTTFLVSVN